MTTLGDVFLVLGGLLMVGVASWAALVLSAIVFPNQSAKIANRISAKPGATLFMGFMIFAPVTIRALVLASVPSPLVKMMALLIFLALLVVCIIGSGGVVRWVSENVKSSAGDISTYGSTTRAAGLIVAACNIPFVGWFLLAPLLLIGSVGAFFGGIKKTVAPEAPGA